VKVPWDIRLTIKPLGQTENDSALFCAEVMVGYSDRKSPVPWGVIVLVRPSAEDYFALQCEGWPPVRPRYGALVVDRAAKEEKLTFEKVYVGNGRTQRTQKIFMIYAIALPVAVIDGLMAAMPKDPTGIPCLKNLADIRNYAPEAVISESKHANVMW
jgi:hypothetical protein